MTGASDFSGFPRSPAGPNTASPRRTHPIDSAVPEAPELEHDPLDSLVQVADRLSARMSSGRHTMRRSASTAFQAKSERADLGRSRSSHQSSASSATNSQARSIS